MDDLYLPEVEQDAPVFTNYSEAFDNPIHYDAIRAQYLASVRAQPKMIRIGNQYTQEFNKATRLPIFQLPGDMRYFDYDESVLYIREFTPGQNAQGDIGHTCHVYRLGRYDAPEPKTKVREFFIAGPISRAVEQSTYSMIRWTAERHEAWFDSNEGIDHMEKIAAHRVERQARMDEERLALRAQQIEQATAMRAELSDLQAQLRDLSDTLLAMQAESFPIEDLNAAEEEISELRDIFFPLRKKYEDLIANIKALALPSVQPIYA